MSKPRTLIKYGKRPGLVNRVNLKRVIDRIKIRMRKEENWEKKAMWATIGQELNDLLLNLE